MRTALNFSAALVAAVIAVLATSIFTVDQRQHELATGFIVRSLHTAPDARQTGLDRSTAQRRFNCFAKGSAALFTACVARKSNCQI